MRRPKDGFTIDDRDEIIPRFHEYEREIEGGSYELYAEVLRRVAVRIAKDIGWPLEPSRAGFLPDSVQRWPAFKETNPQLKKFGDKFQTGLISNIDDKLLGSRAGTSRTTSTSSSPPSRSAPTSPTPPTSPSARGASARRRAGCTSRRATTTTSSRA